MANTLAACDVDELLKGMQSLTNFLNLLAHVYHVLLNQPNIPDTHSAIVLNHRRSVDLLLHISFLA